MLEPRERRRELVEARQIAESLAGDLGASGVSVDDSIARVSVVGAGMRTNPGVAATMFETLAGEGINIAMISTSAIRVSCVVDGDRVEDAVRTLHNVFGLSVG